MVVTSGYFQPVDEPREPTKFTAECTVSNSGYYTGPFELVVRDYPSHLVRQPFFVPAWYPPYETMTTPGVEFGTGKIELEPAPAEIEVSPDGKGGVKIKIKGNVVIKNGNAEVTVENNDEKE